MPAPFPSGGRAAAAPAAVLWPAALIAGLAQAASIAWPWGGEPLWWLQLASLAAFARVLLGARSVRQAAGLGAAFATAWLAGTFWWLFISMHTYGGLAAPLAVLAVLALAAFLGSYYAAAAAVFKAFGPHVGEKRTWAAMLFGALWLLAELARGVWWTGFPWGAGGYAHVEGPLAVLARWVGVYGIGAVAAVAAMLAAQMRASDLRRPGCWALAAVAAAAWAGLAAHRHCAVELCHTPMRAPAKLSVALLQGNIPQDEKFQPGSGVPLALQWYGDALRGTRASLVVAPETAIPLLPQQLVPGYLESIDRRYTASTGADARAALLGIPLGDPEQGYTNSVVGFAPGQAERYRYDKHHLVPFGEFVPPFFRWFTELMNIPLGDFNRGAVGQAPFAWAGQRIAPNICYEDLFGEELAARFADPSAAPTLFVNMSNIAWFGDSVAIDQHLSISRMRALEFERPMARATNTGATALIDHRGVVVRRLPTQQRGILEGEVEGRDGPPTPFAWWAARAGLWPLWLLGVAGAVAAIVAAGRRPR
ncbi:apolipoprotein N-acyltransferase [Paracidovorax anthurii]|uniref:Apolipoprotein N-acyltransferase n=1 Tax=Paracidovorax anthurii TaxID=78229 RepID=A0A328Z5M6_9BURK|nr:apolipoprotein N-acyltransferase [Paracidovorax anthurii]RAR81421.1 apolipoprotein N-acyltransferase [Paracidovorax anthurii]